MNLKLTQSQEKAEDVWFDIIDAVGFQKFHK
jgi:hypothetical protein